MDSMSSSRNPVYTVVLFLLLRAGAMTLDHLTADVIFNDLINLNANCSSRYSCQGNRYSNALGVVNCHCDSKCAILGTCCADSNYRTDHGLGLGFSCVSPDHDTKSPLFMLDSCKRKRNGDDVYQKLCVGDARELDEPLLLVPVNSPKTGITYKNYFCFACNEDYDSVSPIFWELKLSSDNETDRATEESLRDLHYDVTRRSWTISGTDQSFALVVEIPKNIQHFRIGCQESVIETCAKDWTDVETKEKCESYMALVWSRRSLRAYRNPHCAVCNFMDMAEISCRPLGKVRGGVLPPLISGYYVSSENRCPRHLMFDPVSKTCRLVRCGRNQMWYYGECRDRS